MTDFTAEQNPKGVRRGQVWRAPDGREFEVITLERWSVRGCTQPSARVIAERSSNRGLKRGFERCTLVYDPPAEPEQPVLAKAGA